MEKTQPRWMDFPSIFLLIGSLWLSANRLSRTKWTTQLDKVELVLLIGLIIGLALGYSSYPRKVVRWMVAAYSGFVLSWQLSLIGNQELFWAERQIVLLERFWRGIVLFFQNQPIDDPILFLLLMIFLYWVIGLTSGFLLLRSGRPWVPLLISGFALLVVDIYPPFVEGRHLISGLFVLFSALLLWRLSFKSSNLRWKRDSAMVDYGIGFDVSKIVIPMTMTLVLIAWLIPYFAQVITPGTEAQRKFQDFWAPARERLSNVVSGLNAPRSSRMEFYGNSLALGTEITDKEEVVFHVTPELFHPAGTRYYWRGYSYDRYENGFWANTVNDDRLMNPDDWSIEYEIEPFEAFTAFIFDFEVTRSTLIYSPGSPVFVGTSVNYQGESVEEGENYNGVVMNSKVELKAGDRVKVEALVSTATIEQLRNDHIDYPDWVIENYLDLPDTLPESFSILADEIQGELENPYDIADEITQYLREEITYSRQIDPIPRQSDPLEHFLFVSKSGYCNYYASSEVLLLRTLGIPARLSVGFAEGEYDQDIKQFVVSLDDSHAWPEVYFPTYGWIEFEPTAALPIPVRESGIENESERLDSAFEFDGDRQFGGPVLGDEGRFEEYLEEGVDLPTGDLPEIPELVVDEPAKIVSPVLVITPILTVLIILLIYMAWRELKKRRQTLPVFVESYFDHRGLSVPFFVRLWAVRSGLTPIEKYFSEVSLMLAMLGGEVVGKTPSEQVKQLKQLIPDGISASNQLLKEYQLSIYSEKKADLGIVRESRNLLWRLVIKARLRNIFNR